MIGFSFSKANATTINGKDYDTIWNPFGGHLQYTTSLSSTNTIVGVSPIIVTTTPTGVSISDVGGSGGASNLAVSQSGVVKSSPTAVINFLGPPFIVSLTGGATAQVSLNSSSVTLQGFLNDIHNQNSLQSGSTAYPQFLYVGSSASINGQVSVTSIKYPDGTIQVSSPSTGGGGGTPGGSDTQFQFNNSGSFGGSADLTTNGSTITITKLDVSTVAVESAATFLNVSTITIQLSTMTFGSNNALILQQVTPNTVLGVNASGVVVSTTIPSGGGSGTITGVTAGQGLAGGGTTGTVTLNLSPSATMYLQNRTTMQIGATGYPETLYVGYGNGSTLPLFSADQSGIAIYDPSGNSGIVTNGVNLSLSGSPVRLDGGSYTSCGSLTTSGGVIQCGSASSGGYSVEPASVTFLLNKGVRISTLTITSLSPGVAHVIANSSNVVTGLISLSTETTGVYVSSLTVNNSLLLTGTNNAASAAPILAVNFSSAASRDDLNNYLSLSSAAATYQYKGAASGSGSTVYNATSTVGMPFGFSASTASFTSTVTVMGAMSIGTDTARTNLKAQLHIVTPSSRIGLIVQDPVPVGGTGTSDLVQFWDDNGVILSSVTKDGSLITQSTVSSNVSQIGPRTITPYYALTISTSATGRFLLDVSTNGTVGNTGPSPTFNTCGTSGSFATGASNFGGTINVPSDVSTSCSINFSNGAFINPPSCTASDDATGALVTINSITNTTLSFGFTGNFGLVGGGHVWYICKSND